MKNIGRRLFLISFIFALISAAGIYYYLNSLDQSEVQEEIEKMTIVVAAVDIEARTVIDETMLKEIEILPENDYGNFINDLEEIIGYYSKEKIYENERLHSSLLILDTNSELSLKIEGDRRAISINTTLEMGVANLLKSGDFVDIFVSLPELKVEQDVVRPNISKLILQNIEILAIDQNLDREPEMLPEQPSIFLVTLSIPVLEIEKLVLAEDIGNIKLALRPIDAEYIYETEGVIWEELFLNDFNKLKDMFPEYEVEASGTVLVDDTEYEYDKYYHYTIKYGDTLKSISLDFYGSEEMYLLLKQVNRIDDENSILAGSNIKVPALDDNIKEGEEIE